MDSDLCTVGEAARLLGIHTDTLVRWANDGKIAVVRLPSGHRRFRREDVDALLEPEPRAAS